MRTLCLTNNLPPLKSINIDNPLDQFVRIQYGVSEEGLVTLRNIVESIAGFNDDDSMPDLDPGENSDEENDGADSNDDDEKNDSDNSAKKCETSPGRCENEINKNQQNINSEQSSDEPMKRKSPEAGGSLQNKTSTGIDTDVENPKRMKMNKSPRKTESAPSTSTYSAGDLWERVSTISSSSLPQEDSNSWVSSMDADIDENIEPRNRGVYNSLLSDDSGDESDSSSESAKQMKFSFINDRKENELSKLLKVEIDSLPIPNPLKVFLNYY